MRSPAASLTLCRMTHARGADLGTVTRAIAEHAAHLTGADVTCVSLREGNELVIRAIHGAPQRHVGWRLPIQQSLSGWVVANRSVAHARDLESDPRSNPRANLAFDARSAVAVPLTCGDVPAGAVIALSRRRAAFSREHVAGLCDSAGVLGRVLEGASEPPAAGAR